MAGGRQARRRLADDRRRRQRVRRLRHGFRRAVRRPHEPGRAARGRGATRPRVAVRHAVRARRRGVRAARRALRAADVAADQLGHRGHARRDQARARRHRPGADRQGRGWLSRPSRRGDDLQQAGARPRRSGRPPELDPELARHHEASRRGRHRHPVQRPRGARAGAAGRRRGVLHRRAGDAEHRHLPATARLPRGRARDHRALRHVADLRRGQDRHHRRVRRRQRLLRRHARPHHAGEVDRRRLPGRRVRRQGRVHGSDQRRVACSTSARTTAIRS